MLMFPPEFDLAIYSSNSPDLAGMTKDQRSSHYTNCGLAEGRVCSAIHHRGAFLKLVPQTTALLEIGPYTSPAFSRPAYNVRYLDAFNSAQLKAKAISTGMDPHTIPEIDYVWTGESYAELIREPLQVVFSSHNIEHQPDLIRHLQQIGSILEPTGLFFLTIPDRRYCFDHFLPDTNFADVLSAYYDRRIKHVAGHIFEHRMLTTHNDPVLHWSGNHGAAPLNEPVSDTMVSVIAETISRIDNTAGYIDTHAWQFTPSSFRHLLTVLSKTRLINFHIERIYPTVKNSNEFYAILRKQFI